MAMPPGNAVIPGKMQFAVVGGGAAGGGGGNEMQQQQHHRHQWFHVDERDSFISWLRGEFAAANAIIDSLCHHLRLVGEPGEYDFVIGCMHQRRCNWNSVLHMQQYFSVTEVIVALQQVASRRQQLQQQRQQQRHYHDQTKFGVKNDKRFPFSKGQRGSGVGGGEVLKEVVDSSIESLSVDGNSSRNVGTQKFVDKSDDDGRKSEDSVCVAAEDKRDANSNLQLESHLKRSENSEGTLGQNSEAETMFVNDQSNSKDSSRNQNENQTLVTTPKTFVGNEMIDGKPVNVVDGLKLYEQLLDGMEVSKLVSLVNDLRVAGKNRQFQGQTYVVSKRPMKGRGREMIQLGIPIADANMEDENALGTLKDQRIEAIPTFLQDVIDRLVDKQIMTTKPDSCVIDIYNEGDYSQPHMCPSWYGKPVYCLFLTECELTFGRVIGLDHPGHYKGSLKLGLSPGSFLVMQGKSSDVAKHAIPAIRKQRIIVTFAKSEPKKYAPSDDHRLPSPAVSSSPHWGPPSSRSSNHIHHNVPKHYAPITTTGVLPAPSIQPQIPPPNGVQPLFVTGVAAPMPFPAPVSLPPMPNGWPAAPPRHPLNRLPILAPGTGVFLPPPGSGNTSSSPQLLINATELSMPVEASSLPEKENGKAKSNDGTNASAKEKLRGKPQCNGLADGRAVINEEQQKNADHSAANKTAGAV